MEQKLITPNEGKEKIYSLLEEISSSSSSSNVKLLELIVGLEGRFSKANSSNKLLLNKMRDLQSERDEWIRAFYSIVDYLSDFASTKDNSVAEISDRMSSLSALLKESSEIEDELNSFLEEAEENDRYISQVSQQYSELSTEDENVVSLSSYSEESHSSGDLSSMDEQSVSEDASVDVGPDPIIVKQDEETETPEEASEELSDVADGDQNDDSSDDDFDEGFSIKK